MDIKELQRKLFDRKLSIVSEKTGIHPITIARIRDGKELNPKLKTIEKLINYFKGTEQCVKK